jgi:hypothetical protein
MNRFIVLGLCCLMAACTPTASEAPPTSAPTAIRPPPVATSTLAPPSTSTPTPAAPVPTETPIPTATPRRFPTLRFTVPLGSRSGGMVGEIVSGEDFFLQLKVHDTRVGTQDGAGIELVTFEVFGPDGFYYLREERTAPYCAFNGSGRCDPWRLDGDRLLWPDGTLLAAGDYSVQIVARAATPDAEGDNDGNWNFDATIELP